VPPLRKTNVMRSRGMSNDHVIPLFAEKPAHSSVPLVHQSAVARSGGQGRPQAGACALPLTAASTMAACVRATDGALQERTPWIS
jgi:hypothetical protein